MNNYKADILIVDNNPQELRMMSHFLTRQGYYLRQALDGEMALIAVQTKFPDLILLETELPDLNGYEVCQSLKTMETTADIPIVFLNTFDEGLDRIKVFQVGGADYITKPYRFDEVLVRIQNQIKIKTLHQQIKQENSDLKEKNHLLQVLPQFYEESEEDVNLLKMAIVATQNGIIITDANHPENPIIYVNPGFEQITGYSSDEVIGKNCRFLQGTDNDQSGIYAIKQAIQEKKKCCVTLRNYRKDGSIFWNEISISPVQDSQGNITHYIGVQTDVTDRKTTEKERQRYQASLQQMNRELYRLNNQLHRLASLDGLTGVANRRCFDEHLELEWRRCQREKTPLSIILGDIDYFKLYNDTYGHLEGDDCLKAVAQAISQAVHRSGDLAARTGGEEFAVILPNTPLKGAVQVANSISDNIRQLKIPHKSSKVREYVTMSIGVACIIPKPDQSFKYLLSITDQALYAAKGQGRDRVVAYQES